MPGTPLPSRRKIGTLLAPDVFNKAKALAAAEGKSLSGFIEEALVAHIARREGKESEIDRMWGMFKLSPKALREITEDQLFDS